MVTAMTLPQRIKQFRNAAQLAAETGDISLVLSTSLETTMQSINTKIEAACTLLADLEAQRDALLIPYANGDEAVTSRLNELEAAISNAQKDVARLSSARGRVAEQMAVEARAREADELARRWKAAEKLAKRREQVAAEYEEGAAKMAAALKEAIELGLELRSSAPALAPYLYDHLGPDMQAANARIHLLKLGLRWAHSYPWPTDEKPTFSQAVAAENVAVLSAIK